MAINKSNIWWILIIVVLIVVLGMFFQKSYDVFAVFEGGGVERTVQLQVSPGETFQITYLVSTTELEWGAIIEDTVSGGCTFPAGTGYQSVMLSTEGKSKPVTITAPSSEGSCTFSGDYTFIIGSEISEIIYFEDNTITISSSSQDTCADLGGSCCTSGQNCEGGSFQTVSDCNNCCVSGTCETPTQTCADLGGAICPSGETCSIDVVSASDTTECCLGTCEEGGFVFPFDLDEWFSWAAYYDINSDGVKDGMDGLIIVIGGLFGLLIISRMM